MTQFEQRTQMADGGYGTSGVGIRTLEKNEIMGSFGNLWCLK